MPSAARITRDCARGGRCELEPPSPHTASRHCDQRRPGRGGPPRSCVTTVPRCAHAPFSCMLEERCAGPTDAFRARSMPRRFLADAQRLRGTRTNLAVLGWSAAGPGCPIAQRLAGESHAPHLYGPNATLEQWHRQSSLPPLNSYSTTALCAGQRCTGA
ncbi:hypothetical protein DAEQUDRAFT_90664 [Daedalea quercina L-15889]|uniref:Uncharacterized protein n=1 Tax=Daedalea quercina L-15889 TaxID=1314783 RepID=A0A165S7X5_9APHY|nr:hypothetical protein DAEQUDRAFT_90664 [Daedalea quercina L-15889]